MVHLFIQMARAYFLGIFKLKFGDLLINLLSQTTSLYLYFVFSPQCLAQVEHFNVSLRCMLLKL